MAIALLLLGALIWETGQGFLGVRTQILTLRFRLPGAEHAGTVVTVHDHSSSNHCETVIAPDGTGELNIIIRCTASVIWWSRQTKADAFRILLAASSSEQPGGASVPLSMILGRRKLTGEDFQAGLEITALSPPPGNTPPLQLRNSSSENPI